MGTSFFLNESQTYVRYPNKILEPYIRLSRDVYASEFLFMDDESYAIE